MEYKCKLKVLLAENDLKHGEFAKMVGVSLSTMSGLVNTKTLPTFSVAYRISEELNMDIRDIWVKVVKEEEE